MQQHPLVPAKEKIDCERILPGTGSVVGFFVIELLLSGFREGGGLGNFGGGGGIALGGGGGGLGNFGGGGGIALGGGGGIPSDVDWTNFFGGGIVETFLRPESSEGTPALRNSDP